MAQTIWGAAAATPNKDHRLPADTGVAGTPTRYTVQQLADLESSVGKSHNAIGSIATNTAIDLSLGGYVSATIAGSLTFTFTNPPASPNGCEWTLILTNGGAHTITWPGSVTWAGATAPVLTASGVDVLHFATGNGGTNWYGWHERDESTLAAGSLTGQVALANGGTGANLTDPNADRIMFWDDSAGSVAFLTAGSGLTITDTTIAATATGSATKTLARFTAGENQPPASSFATIDTRNSILVLDFDAAANESAIFVSSIPEGAVLTSGLLVRIHWMATSATTGDVRWRVAFEAGGTDLDADSFDTATEASGTANATSGIETITEITATNIDSLVAGNRFRMRVTRVGTDGTNDTMAGDAELTFVEVRQVA